jgi:DnaJ domain
MSDAIQAYPLCWPAGWKRTKSYARRTGRFRDHPSLTNSRSLSVSQGVERVLLELSRLKIGRDDTLISTNVALRLDGLPRSDQREPEDPGVAVYWKKGKKPSCMAIDRYTRVGDNLAAIAATLEAMRAIERHGGAEILDRAFTGFIALPAPEQWFTILNVSANATREEIERAHWRLAQQHHPDKGGNAAEMARINVARDEGLARL